MIEKTILQNLLYNEEYVRKVIPFLTVEYFADFNNRVVFDLIKQYLTRYNKVPNKETLKIDLDKKKDLTGDQFNLIVECIDSLSNEKITSLEWLIDNTEKYCKERAVYNAIMESINIIDNKVKDKTTGSIPQLLSDALGVSFDTNVGHDFLEDFEARYDFYHLKENKIEFDIELLNKITKGGLSRKTINVIMASTGVGKSLIMCHMAAANIAAGYNVLYITLEMSEEKIAQRIEANLMDQSINEIELMPRDVYVKKISRLVEKIKGKLVIKEFPTSIGHAGHFRHLINELKLKKNFIPDIVYIDYINICASSRIKLGASQNSYFYVKAIAEELRGLGVEFNVPLVTGTQVNRDGSANSDMEISEVAESWGLPATADLMLAVITTEELERLNQYMFKQLKNRYNDKIKNKRFVVGVDREKMKLYDVEDTEQTLVDDEPIFETTSYGSRHKDEGKRFNKLHFE